MVGVPHPTRRKNEGKNPGRKHLELSERRRVFARKKTGEEVVSSFGRKIWCLPDDVVPRGEQ